MELKAFVAETLTAIVEGVLEAQSTLAEKGAHINPVGLTRTVNAIGENAIWDNSTNNFARNVCFDVALTVDAGTQAHAKIGVFSGLITVGAGGESDTRQLAASRVSFVVPLLLPGSQVKGAKIMKAAKGGQ